MPGSKQAFKVKQASFFFSLRKLVFHLFRNQFSLVPAAGPPDPVRGEHQMGAGAGGGAIYNLRVFGSSFGFTVLQFPRFPKRQFLGRRENCMSLTWILLRSSLVLETFFIQWSNKHQPWSSLAHLQLLLIV